MVIFQLKMVIFQLKMEKNNHLKTYLLLKVVIFQPAMLVFQGNCQPSLEECFNQTTHSMSFCFISVSTPKKMQAASKRVSGEPRKKPSYFPLNPGWLIGILIMVYFGSTPLPGFQWQMKVYRDPLLKMQ